MNSFTTDLKAAARISGEIRHAIQASGGPLPPAFIVQFLLGDWCRYLTLTLDAFSEDSEEVRTAMDTTALLLCSVRPVPTEEDKAELVERLPQLIAGLKDGMTSAGISAEDQEAFLLQLRDWHVELMARRKGYEAAGRAFDPTRKPGGDDTLQLDVQDIRCRELMDMLDNAEAEYIELVADELPGRNYPTGPARR
jgi:hypothetical protein